MSNKLNKYKLDSKAANDMLQNILKSCDIKPNDIPLNVLEVRHAQKYAFLHVARGLCVFFFLLTLFCPLVFARPADKVIVEHRAISNLNVIEHKHEGDSFYIMLNSAFPVDIDSCYVETDSGYIYEISDYNPLLNQLVFPYPKENATIYICTTDGALLQLYLQVSLS